MWKLCPTAVPSPASPGSDLAGGGRLALVRWECGRKPRALENRRRRRSKQMQFTSIYNVRRCNLQSMNSDLLSDASFCNLQCTKRANFKESEGNPSLLHWQGREVASRATFQTYKDLKLSKLTLNSLSCKKMQKDGCGNWLSSL